jgi:hypothetical protein
MEVEVYIGDLSDPELIMKMETDLEIFQKD